MAQTNDILMHEFGDVLCMGGDFAIGDATLQHQKDLLDACKGEYKESPTVGVGIYEFLNSEDPSDMIREIKDQFLKDGMEVNLIKATAEGLNINAQYK
jgi:hypothetical protein